MISAAILLSLATLRAAALPSINDGLPPGATVAEPEQTVADVALAGKQRLLIQRREAYFFVRRLPEFDAFLFGKPLKPVPRALVEPTLAYRATITRQLPAPGEPAVRFRWTWSTPITPSDPPVYQFLAAAIVDGDYLVIA